MANKPHTSRAKATPAYAKPNTSGKPVRPRSPSGASSSSGASASSSASGRPSKTVWLVVVIVAALAIAAAIVAVLARSGSSSSDDPSTVGLEQTQPVTVTGTPLAAFPDSGADPALGVTAPRLSGLSFDGTPVTVGGAKSDATLVVYLAHWCPHCQRELPKLAKWQADREVPEGVNVVGIATQTSSDQPNYPPSSWLTKSGISAPIMADSPTYEAASAYGMSSWPAFVLLDKDGVVRWRGTGEIDMDTLTSTITTALGETTSSTPVASTPTS
jgi:thiol-disulfide isomerase/thioredoxin